MFEAVEPTYWVEMKDHLKTLSKYQQLQKKYMQLKEKYKDLFDDYNYQEGYLDGMKYILEIFKEED